MAEQSPRRAVVFVALGTLGDALPLCSLALGLKLPHASRVITSADVDTAGILSLLPPDTDQLVIIKSDISSVADPRSELCVSEQLDQLCDLVSPHAPCLLCVNLWSVAALHVAEALGCSVAICSPAPPPPGSTPSTAQRRSLENALRSAPLRSSQAHPGILGTVSPVVDEEASVYAGLWMAPLLSESLYGPWRTKRGLPSVPALFAAVAQGIMPPLLYGYSPLLLPRPGWWPSAARVCGPWAWTRPSGARADGGDLCDGLRFALRGCDDGGAAAAYAPAAALPRVVVDLGGVAEAWAETVSRRRCTSVPPIRCAEAWAETAALSEAELGGKQPDIPASGFDSRTGSDVNIFLYSIGRAIAAAVSGIAVVRCIAPLPTAPSADVLDDSDVLLPKTSTAALYPAGLESSAPAAVVSAGPSLLPSKRRRHGYLSDSPAASVDSCGPAAHGSPLSTVVREFPCGCRLYVRDDALGADAVVPLARPAASHSCSVPGIPRASVPAHGGALGVCPPTPLQGGVIMVPHRFPHHVVLRGKPRRPVVSESPTHCSPPPDVHEPPGEAEAPVVAALVHHGGAGTSHTAAAAGVAQVVLPLRFDQALWAGRLEVLGVAPPVPPGLKRACGVAVAAAAVADAVSEVVIGKEAVSTRLAAVSLRTALEEEDQEEEEEEEKRAGNEKGGCSASTVAVGGDGGTQECVVSSPSVVASAAVPHPSDPGPDCQWVPSAGIASACRELLRALCEG